MERFNLNVKICISKRAIVLTIALLLFGCSANTVFAQNGIFIPLIGITSVPTPLALPNGPGNVTYSYAVKNFLSEKALSNVLVVDDKCSPVKYVEGDDNKNGMLDYIETWRYNCSAKLATTTQSTATATGTAFGLLASHQAFATVVVGSSTPPPLVSIVNITKVAYPLSLPIGGGAVTFTYKVNNPGVVPLSNVTVVDDKCISMSGKLGDTNGNGLLDTNEVWIYTCTTQFSQTTTNTATVTAYANGLKATGFTTLTIKVDTSAPEPSPNLLDVGISPTGGAQSDLKISIWKILLVVLVALVVLFVLMRKIRIGKT